MAQTHDTMHAALRLGEGQQFSGTAPLALTKAFLQAGLSAIVVCKSASEGVLAATLRQALPVLEECAVSLNQCDSLALAQASLVPAIAFGARCVCICQDFAECASIADEISACGQKGALLLVLEHSGEAPQHAGLWQLEAAAGLQELSEQVGRALQLSEASQTPVVLLLPPGWAHVHGSLTCKNNRGAKALPGAVAAPTAATPLALRHAKAVRALRQLQLNEIHPGTLRQVGMIVQGNCRERVDQALAALGLRDGDGGEHLPRLSLQLSYPLSPDELQSFCSGKRAVLVIESDPLARLELAVNAVLRRADNNDTCLVGQELLSDSKTTAAKPLHNAIVEFLQLSMPDGVDLAALAQRAAGVPVVAAAAPAQAHGLAQPHRFRPLFTALKLFEKESGRLQLYIDPAAWEQASGAGFQFEHILPGRSLALAPLAGLEYATGTRSLSVVDHTTLGDAGVWSALVQAAREQRDGVVLVLADDSTAHGLAQRLGQAGVRWLHTHEAPQVAPLLAHLRLAFGPGRGGLRVLIVAPVAVRAPEVVIGIDTALCQGGAACRELSACSALHTSGEAVARVLQPDASCQSCAACAGAAQSAALCPAFYAIELSQPGRWQRVRQRLRRWLAGTSGAEALQDERIDSAIMRFPPELFAVLSAGAVRLTNYQDAAYALLYLERLQAVLAVDREAGGAADGYRLSHATATHLARWMSYDDLMQVAREKLKPARWAALQRQAGGKTVAAVREYLAFSDGQFEEFLPQRWAQSMQARLRRRMQPLASPQGGVVMPLTTDSHSLTGILFLRVVAGLRRWRRHSVRYGREQALIKRWLGGITRLGFAAQDLELAGEISACAGLLHTCPGSLAQARTQFLKIFDSIIESGQENDPKKLAAAIRNARLGDQAGRALQQKPKKDDPGKPVFWMPRKKMTEQETA